jgi:hypothetical protein
MKTHSATLEVERSGVQVEGQFSIKATSKAFDILSSGLYSDKIQAIVRELSCNAHDSHVAAGKPDLPIEIRLPTHLEPTFYVKDFGLGLSHEGVMKLYTTYFESTKTDSDAFIGQLGLGSKSPFSYASAFLVESCFEGMKRIYSCFKNEQNLPAIVMMSEEATSDINGITVTLAVRRDDVDKFQTAAKKALMYFNPKPKVVGRTGFEPYRMVHTVSGTNWRIRDTEYYAYMSGAHVVQGFVAYPIDAHLLGENGISTTAAALASTDIDMFVEIGKVEVAASREALSYDKRTIMNLIGAFEEAALEMRKSFQAEFDKCVTAWDAAMLLDKFEASGSGKFREIFKNMHKASPFQWNGKDATTEMVLDLAKVKTTTVSRCTIGGRKSSKLAFNGQWHPETSTAKTFEWNAQGNTHVLIDAEAKGTNDAVRQWIGDLPSKDGRSASVLLIRPIGRSQYSQAEVDNIVKMLGSPAVTLVKNLPYTKAAYKKGSYVKRAAEVKLVFSGFPQGKGKNHRGRENGVRRVFSRLCWIPTEIEIDEGGFYVSLERFAAMDGARVADNLDTIIKTAKNLGLLDTDAVIVGLNEKEVGAAVKSGGEWIELFSYLRNEFAEENQNGEMYSRVVADAVFGSIGTGVRDHLVQNWDTVGATVVDGEFKTAVQDLVSLHAAAGKYNTDTVVNFTNSLGIKRTDDNRTLSMPNAWKRMLSHYEMLSLIEMGHYDARWVKPVINYVNIVDTK